MRSLKLILAALAATALMTGPSITASAAPGSTGATAPLAGTPTVTVTGRIIKVTDTTLTLTKNRKCPFRGACRPVAEPQTQIALTSDTQVVVDGATASLDALRVDQWASVRAQADTAECLMAPCPRTGHLVAIAVTATSAPKVR